MVEHARLAGDEQHVALGIEPGRGHVGPGGGELIRGCGGDRGRTHDGRRPPAERPRHLRRRQRTRRREGGVRLGPAQRCEVVGAQAQPRGQAQAARVGERPDLLDERLDRAVAILGLGVDSRGSPACPATPNEANE